MIKNMMRCCKDSLKPRLPLLLAVVTLGGVISAAVLVGTSARTLVEIWAVNHWEEKLEENQQLIQQGVLPNPQVMVNPLAQQQQQQQPQNGISLDDYKFIFNESSVGMAIASLGGAFVDCNPIFSQLSEYTKEEICTMTIFNITNRQDLQNAFDLISQMISPTLEGNHISGGKVGLGLGSDSATPLLSGNTICENETGVSLTFGAEMPETAGNDICPDA